MMAIEKSNNGLSPPPKILISHGLPVLSGSNPQVVRTPPREYHYPTPPPKKKKKKKKKEAISDLPPPQKTKQNKNKDPEKKWKKKKEKKRELSLRILPRRTRLLTSLYREKARKAWPTATILNEIFEFSEIYVCQKY